jgi:recombination protein RecT
LANELALKDRVLKDTNSALMKLIDSKVQAMPKDFNKTRFMQNCMTVLQDTNGIEKCNPLSTARTLLKGAFLGLDFFMKECYAIPYNDYKNNTCSLQFQTDFKGERKLMKKYSVRAIKDIYAKVVRESDEFEEIVKEGIPTINFKAKPFNTGKIIGVFAVVLFDDGGMLYETMATEEIEKIKTNFSKKDKNGNYSKAWEATPEEMYKKTVIRRLRKSVELEFESQEQAQSFEETSEFEFKNAAEKPKSTEKSPFEKGAAVEAEYEEVPTGSMYEGTPFEDGGNNAAN